MTKKQKEELKELKQSIVECLDRNIKNNWKDAKETLNLITLIFNVFRKLEIY